MSGGRAAKAAGDQFESWLEDQHTIAMYLGIVAHVEKNEPHSKIIHGRVMYTSPGIADWTGTLEGGRSLAVEQKSTKDNRLALSAVEPKQQKHLEAVARAGGLALLVVEFRNPPLVARQFAIPWLDVPWTVARTAKSVCAGDLAKWAVLSLGEGKCYLSPYHPGGPRSSTVGGGRMRRFARE